MAGKAAVSRSFMSPSLLPTGFSREVTGGGGLRSSWGIEGITRGIDF